MNPRLAARILPESELAGFLGLFFKELGDESIGVCEPARLPPRAPQGMGGYAFVQVFREYYAMEDPRRALATNPAPARVMRGSCEWLKPEVARDYVQTFPRSRFVEMAQAGHLLYLEKTEDYLKEVRGVLLE